jgi:outer membrane receptor protein involved in Fe transport
LLVAGAASAASADEPPPAETQAEPLPAEAPAELPPAEAAGPRGKVTGRAIDTSTQVGLPGATVRATGGPGGDRTIATETDGTFALELPPGSYRIEVSTPEYVSQRRTVTVTASGEIHLELGLDLVAAQGREEQIEVQGSIDTRRASAVLAERRAAASVRDAISAEQIARSPDGSASDAAKRMVAATIQDHRYVVIRGLGGRYSLTLLNGVPLPSPDPDLPAAPLDLFPAALITSLTIDKSFTPDLPASFAGGALGIETRNYPARLSIKARLALGNNTLSSFRTQLGPSGSGGLGLLGFGASPLPGQIPEGKLAGDPSLPSEQRTAQMTAFGNDWSLEQGTAGPNLGLGASVGDTLKVAGQRLGYFASASLGRSYTQQTAHIARVGEADGAGGKLPSVLQLDDDRSAEQVSLGAIAAAGWSPRAGHKLDLFALYTQGAEQSASQVTGTENNSSIVDRTRLQLLQRELAFVQLLGEHRLAPRVILAWQGHVARVAQHEPDTHDLLRTRLEDGRYAISGGVGSAERLYGELGDTTVGGAAAVRLPLDRVQLRAGTAIQRSARDYQQRRFHFDVRGESVFLEPDDAFAPGNAGADMSMYEATLPTDGYSAARTIAAAYAMADASPTDKLRLIGGARLELSRLDIGLASKLDLMLPPTERTRRTDADVLPAASAVYALTPSTNLRAAYGMTVARPSFREIAPALYYDYIRRRAIGGNPDLERTRIHNGDLRWERFLGDSEVLAASVFGKRFERPIERTIEGGADGQSIGFANTDGATVYGLELEARLSLGRLAPALAPFSVGGNLSLIGSRIDIGGGATRPLQGQSPYVANLGLGYESARHGTRVDVLYNTSGRRIEEVGTSGEGNVYEEPLHRLDLAVSHPLPGNLRLKLAGQNLLDQRAVRTQDGVEILAYKVGVTVIGGVELGLE